MMRSLLVLSTTLMPGLVMHHSSAQAQAPSQTGEAYPPEVVASFLQSCTAESRAGDADTLETLTNYCTCFIDTLQSQYTLEETLAFAARLQQNDAPDELIAIGDTCKAELSPASFKPAAEEAFE